MLTRPFFLVRWKTDREAGPCASIFEAMVCNGCWHPAPWHPDVAAPLRGAYRKTSANPRLALSSMSPMPSVTRWWWIRHAPVPDGGRIYGQSDLPCDCSDSETFAALAAEVPA